MQVGNNDTQYATLCKYPKTFPNQLPTFLKIQMFKEMRGIDGTGGVGGKWQGLSDVVDENLRIPGHLQFVRWEQMKRVKHTAHNWMLGEPRIPRAIHIDPSRRSDKAAPEVQAIQVSLRGRPCPASHYRSTHTSGVAHAPGSSRLPTKYTAENVWGAASASRSPRPCWLSSASSDSSGWPEPH